jgi:NAD kinase
VNVIQTDSEGQAQRLVESLDEVVDAIVVTGGDGTVSEVIIRFAHLVTSFVWSVQNRYMFHFQCQSLFIELDI